MKTQHHKTLRIAAALALTAMLSGQAFADPAPAQSNNATADVTVQLIQPISIQKVSDLNFGTLLTGGSANIILHPSGDFEADSRAMPSLGSLPQVAQFEVSGEPFLNYSLSSNDSVVLTNENSNTLFVNLFAGILSTGSNSGGTLSSSGEDTIYVGGSFSMNEQARGTYTAPGGINLTVNYD